MKQKDLVYLLLAVVILLVAGYIGYTQLMPQKAASKTVEVEKIGVIPDHLDDEGLARLNDPEKVQDFSTPIEFTGLNNSSVFGQ